MYQVKEIAINLGNINIFLLQRIFKKDVQDILQKSFQIVPRNLISILLFFPNLINEKNIDLSRHL